MKIAMLHWGFPPIIGGVETHLLSLMPELVKMGNEVSLLTGTAEGSPNHLTYKGAKVYRSQFYDLNWLFKSGFQEVDDNVEDITYDYLNKTKPDVIHAHNMHYFSRYHTRVLENYALEHHLPLILTAHNSWTDKLFLDLTCKVKWDRIIAISEYIKRELVAVGFPADRVPVIHHGIDSAKFSPGKIDPRLFKAHPELKKAKGKQIIFSPARMGLAKGCDIVIEAFRQVKDKTKDVFLLMSGSGNIIDWGLTQNKDIAFFVSLIKHLGLQDDVYINTFSINEEMPQLYRMADVVVYPSSVEEPFGLAMLESMATAKPIVVTNSGGMPEIIKDNVNGFVVPKRNHEELAERITRLLFSDDLRKDMGNIGRELVEKFYTKQIYAKKIWEVYDKAIQEKRSRGTRAKHKRKKSDQ
ncbi:MAG: glycosyltransferase family 4 protein, partial [Candidatus Margulisbacteria bacterium]|nr:glycosyltransferase family 4 protein [Candidatus Margulisiibacteriota bacterium]